jgi:hypothetical protein
MPIFRNWLVAQESALLKAHLGNQYDLYQQSLASSMPPSKVAHSMRAGKSVAKAGVNDQDVLSAAILHDYLERGGNPDEVIQRLGISPRALKLMQLMTVAEKTPGLDDNSAVYQHMQQVIGDPQLDQETKNYLILIKASDRLDNIRKRFIKGTLDKIYYNASVKLLHFLFSSYQGAQSLIQYLLDKWNKLRQKIYWMTAVS